MKYPYEHLKDLKYREKQVELFKNWVRNNEIVKQLPSACIWTNLLPGSKRYMQKDARDWGYYPKIDGNEPPYNDHFLLFEDFHGDRVYVYQPYNCKQEEILLWAENKGIAVTFYEKKYSLYYHNNTYLIELRIRDK